jgi:hypothetical protein
MHQIREITEGKKPPELIIPKIPATYLPSWWLDDEDRSLIYGT